MSHPELTRGVKTGDWGARNTFQHGNLQIVLRSVNKGCSAWIPPERVVISMSARLPIPGSSSTMLADAARGGLRQRQREVVTREIERARGSVYEYLS